ncbi:MAG: ANTAR domain-containing protein [Actinomycetota bacterium]|nr:ANTAR domain-containing protein [Actinomycetota bacterium]
MRPNTVYGIDFAADAEQLRQSMQSRPSPDVAKGVLMVLYGCDSTQAFAELLRVSEEERVLLTELAAALVHLVEHDAAELDERSDDDSDIDPPALAAAAQAWGPALERLRTVTTAGHLYGLPRGAHRLAEAAEYITDLLTPRALVSLGMILRPREENSA